MKLRLFDGTKTPHEKLLEYMNFNPQNSNRHNVYVLNIRSSDGVIYKDNKWSLMDKNEIVNQILKASEEDLKKIHDSLKEYYTKECLKGIKDQIKIINRKDNKKIRKYIINTLHTNRDMIIETRKLIDKQNKTDD